MLLVVARGSLFVVCGLLSIDPCSPFVVRCLSCAFVCLMTVVLLRSMFAVGCLLFDVCWLSVACCSLLC